MEKIKRYMWLVLGAFIIAVTLNLFFADFELMPAGFFGFEVLFSAKMGASLATIVLAIELIIIILGELTISHKTLKKAYLSSILIPLFIMLTKNINSLIDITSADKLLISIFGGVLVGLGSRFIYRTGFLVNASDIFERLFVSIFGPNGKIINVIVDILIFLFAILNFGLENAMYSAVSMVIIEYMNRKSIIGISGAKVFYIITKEEMRIRKFIMDELHYDLTIFDVKGGFTKNKNKVIMSAIDTKDYYKLREGIKKIDPSAFITITDSYEVINSNITLKSL